MNASLVKQAYLVSGMPQILLAPDQSPGWQRLHEAYGEMRKEIAAEEADLILYFSTQWLSILGYMFQANPEPAWTHVDQNWHELGSIPYRFAVDNEFSAQYAREVAALGYKTRLIDYQGFPIDTGTIVAQKLLNPDNRLPAAMVSCNMYSEKAETTLLGQAAAKALAASGKKAIVVLVSNLSQRFHVKKINPREDRVSSKKDDEWNRKILDLLGGGALEDAAQCAREFARQANADMKFKGIWWLNGLLGQSNQFEGRIYGYEAVMGSGAALLGLKPTAPVLAPRGELLLASEEGSQADLVEELSDFESLTRPRASAPPQQPLTKAESPDRGTIPDFEIVSKTAAEPVGAYPHARRYGDLLFLSGIGPRRLDSKEIPGLTLGPDGSILDYDIRVQTRAVVDNLTKILHDAGSSLEKIIDIQVFLTNMKRDFAAYNEVYAEVFGKFRPTRTTVEVGALPTPIAIEFKVMARP